MPSVEKYVYEENKNNLLKVTLLFILLNQNIYYAITCRKCAIKKIFIQFKRTLVKYFNT